MLQWFSVVTPPLRPLYLFNFRVAFILRVVFIFGVVLIFGVLSFLDLSSFLACHHFWDSLRSRSLLYFCGHFHFRGPLHSGSNES